MGKRVQVQRGISIALVSVIGQSFDLLVMDTVELVGVSESDIEVEIVVEGVIGCEGSGEVGTRQRGLRYVEFDDMGAVVDATTDGKKNNKDEAEDSTCKL